MFAGLFIVNKVRFGNCIWTQYAPHLWVVRRHVPSIHSKRNVGLKTRKKCLLKFCPLSLSYKSLHSQCCLRLRCALARGPNNVFHRLCQVAHHENI